MSGAEERGGIGLELEEAGQEADAGPPAATGPEPIPSGGVLADLPSRFRLLAPHGAGGMGTVYSVFDEKLGTRVALKTLNEVNAEQLYQLKAEFRAVANISHPNLVRLYELFVTPRGCFFTMELVEGSDLVSYVRERGQDGLASLTAAGAQLASAIRAIHLARRLHRDVKPANVLVSREGRVALLDFGLSAPFRPDADATVATSQLSGTVGYMPPEQALGAALDASADWYAFGATIYEAATGRLPFEPRHSLWRTKGPTPRARIRDVVPEFPPVLDELVTRMLDLDPALRPNGAEILARFSEASAALPRTAASEPHRFLVGREREMADLRRALDDVQSGRMVTAYVHGPSGIGKTELVRHFVESAARTGCTVLSGRCHPFESVPFNALDGMIDDLSQSFRHGGSEELVTRCSEHFRSLAPMFPVLGRSDESLASASPDSDADTWTRGARSLREIFRTIGDSTPLVIWLDDLQWADEDSLRFLHDLVRGTDTLPLLLIVSLRSDAWDGTPVRPLHADLVQGAARVVDIALSPLSSSDALALIEGVAGSSPHREDGRLSSLLEQARGIPFFVHEVARAVVDALPQALSQDRAPVDFLAHRISTLSQTSRRLVEVVCVAGAPIRPELVLQAAGIASSERSLFYDLEADHLLRSTQASDAMALDIYHHCLRDAVLRSLDEATRRKHHSAIAAAVLSGPQPNYSRVVEHLDAAGDFEDVRKHLLPAARQAEAVFAFDSAARWYSRALELGGLGVDDVELRELLGGALAAAGRGPEAGRVFEHAAGLAEEAGLPPERSLRLRRGAAEQYLKSWQREDARRALASVVGPLGIQMPKTARDALMNAAINRVHIWWRGLDAKQGKESKGAIVADRLGVLLLLMQVYAMTEHTYSFAFGSRLLREALSCDDPDLLVNGLAAESVAWAALAGNVPQRAADRHLAAMQRLSESHPSPYRTATLLQCRGITDYFRGEFGQAVANLEIAVVGMRRLATEKTVIIASNFAFRLSALAFLGRLREQAQLLDRALEDAQARGDDYLVATCAAGNATLSWLWTGRHQECTQWAERVLSLAPPGFSSQHFHYLITKVNSALLQGSGMEAWTYVDENWRAIEANQFLALSCIGEDLRQTRARAALAAAPHASGRLRDRLLTVARKEAAHLDKSALACASAWAGIIRAGVAGLNGSRGEAIKLLERSAGRFGACGMEHYASASRYVGATLEGQEDRRAVAERELLALGVAAPDVVSQALVPGVI